MFLLPLAVPPPTYLMRPVADLQNMLALPAFRMGPVSNKLPSLRWFVAQTALLLFAFSLMVFVLIPSDPLWRGWFAQAQASMLPECQAALGAIQSQHSASENAIVLFG